MSNSIQTWCDLVVWGGHSCWRRGMGSSFFFFSSPLCPSGVSTVNHPASMSLLQSSASSSVPSTNLVLLFIHESPLWSSSRSPACQFHPQHPPTDIVSVLLWTCPNHLSLAPNLLFSFLILAGGGPPKENLHTFSSASCLLLSPTVSKDNSMAAVPTIFSTFPTFPLLPDLLQPTSSRVDVDDVDVVHLCAPVSALLSHHTFLSLLKVLSWWSPGNPNISRNLPLICGHGPSV